MKILNKMNVSIDDILTTSNKVMPVVGGNVMRGIRKTDAGFAGFGEAYFSYIEPKKIKAWKKHFKMTLNLIVPYGNVMFVFMDEKRQFRKEIIGDTKKIRLTVPPGLWFGFKGLGNKESIILNISNIIHDDNEVVRKDCDSIDYDWNTK